MQKPAQKAKARARSRTRPPTRAPANDNVVRLAAVEPLQLTAEYVVAEEHDEAPFAPPPVDDIFGIGECDEEETLFVDQPRHSGARAARTRNPGANDEIYDLLDSGFNAPHCPGKTVEESAGKSECADEKDLLPIEEDAPFDPPEFEDEPVFSAPASLQAEPVVVEPPPPRPLQPMEMPRDRLVPAINIYASWDRPEAEALLQAFVRDARLIRANVEIARGGLEGAAARCHAGEAPDLLILDTTLQGVPMLAGLDRLREAAPHAKIVIIGAVNDIGLLRELAARNVSDYIVPPAKAEDLASSACQLFADAAPARVIAVIGARGGIGASTIAHNLAWSIAERQQAGVALVDLDLSFGSAAFNFKHDAELSVADVMRADDSEEMLTRALTKLTPRLQLLSAPAAVESVELDVDAFEAMVAEVRRASRYVVLDLPHVWEPWVRNALNGADEIVIVAGADLASLRNADNMLKLMRSERDKPSAPMVVLSMMGVPKRPEIPLKDFAEALCVRPALTFAFEPELFANAEAAGQMIHEAVPDAKAALQLDMLATMLTGREPIARPAPRLRSTQSREAPAESAPIAKTEPETAPAELPVLDLVIEAPPEQPRKQTTKRAARTGFLALQAPPLKPRRRSRGIARAAAAVLALTLACAWDVQQHRGEVDATTQPATADVNATRA